MTSRKQPPARPTAPQRRALEVAVGTSHPDRPVIGSVPRVAEPDADLHQASAGQRRAFSIDEFCRLYGIGRRTLYDLWDEGRGPRFFKVGARVLISVEAAVTWCRQLEDEAAEENQEKGPLRRGEP